MLLCYFLKPLDHAEHNAHCQEAHAEEHAPAGPQRHLVVHQRADPQEEVAHRGGAEPESLAKSEKVLRGDASTRTRDPEER